MKYKFEDWGDFCVQCHAKTDCACDSCEGDPALENHPHQDFYFYFDCLKCMFEGKVKFSGDKWYELDLIKKGARTKKLGLEFLHLSSNAPLTVKMYKYYHIGYILGETLLNACSQVE